MNACGSGISSALSRYPPRSTMAKTWRAPSGLTVSMLIASGAHRNSLLGTQAKDRRVVFLEHAQDQNAIGRAQPMFVIMIMLMAAIAMPMMMAMPVVVMMSPTGQQPRRGHVHREPQAGDRDSLGEVDGHRCDKP